MGIASVNKPAEVNADPKIDTEVYDTITDSVIDAKVKCLTKELEGSPLVTTYYAQRKGRDDKFDFSDTNLSPSYQSYIKINDLVISVIDTMDYSIDSTTGIASGDATALIPKYMKFYPGDVFIAKGVNNERTMYRVKTVELVTVHRESPYRITYSLFGPVTDTSPELIDVENKTYAEYFYNDKYVTSCNGPLLSEEVVTEVKDLNVALSVLLKEYLRLFTDRDTDALLIDREGEKVFDPFLNRFMVKIIPTEYKIRRSIRGFSTNDIEGYTIFDYMINPELVDYTTPIDAPLLRSKDSFGNNRSILYLGFMMVQWFVDTGGSELLTDKYPVNPYQGLIDVDGVQVNLLPDITGSGYILSDTFYIDGGNSIIETEITNFMNGDEINGTNLLFLAKTFKLWSDVEKYYFGALIIALLKKRVSLC